MARSPARGERDQACHDAHHPDDAQVVRGDEHGVRGAERAGDDRQDGDGAGRLERQPQRRPAQQPDGANADRAHRAGTARGDEDHLYLRAAHAWSTSHR
jgi:hypothetical protein